MKNSFGNNIKITVFGESHGPFVGCVIDGLRPGLSVNEEAIAHSLSLRRPRGEISTARSEEDNFTVGCGVYGGRTTGAPVVITIPNNNVRSSDYSSFKTVARPSHADYTAFVKYNGANDFRGGGRFSGRLTAALCAAGGMIMPWLNEMGICIGTHIKSIEDVFDRPFDDLESDVRSLSSKHFAVLDESAGEAMRERITKAKAEGDSVGGVLETAVTGIAAGVGEPFFDSVESLLSHALFSIPGIKGVEFGAGFEISKMRGSVANDPFFAEDGAVYTKTNNSGGINGGITNGMPVVFRCAVRPTPTIAREQQTVDFVKRENTVLSAPGRHDPCIVHRVRAVVDSVAAFVVYDLLSGE